MRAASAILPMLVPGLFLTGCGQGAGGEAASGRKLECAIGGSAEFAPSCVVEDVAQEGRRILVVRHPDGGFRRFEAVSDGRGVVPADGVEDSRAQWIGADVLEIAVGADRYRFPATMKPDDAPQP